MKNIKVWVLAALTVLLTSCYQDFIQKPNSSFSPDNFYNDLKEAEIGVNGIYAELLGPRNAYGEYFITLSTHGTHDGTTMIKNATLNSFANFNFDKASPFLNGQWASYYKIIFRANQVINRLNENLNFEAGSKDQILRDRLMGEAKFLRALSYFNLVRFWGDVPLILDELKDFTDVNRPRVESSKIYEAIIEDLQFAEKHLYHADWSSAKPAYSPAELGRATCGAAKGLLAKVYMTKAGWPLNDEASWQLAYDKAKEVMEEKEYSLDPDYGHLFTVEGKYSKEWMFQVQASQAFERGNCWGGIQNPTGSNKAISRGFGRVAPTLALIEHYDYRDPRFNHNIAPGNFNPDNTIKFLAPQEFWFSYKFHFTTKPIANFKTDMPAPVLRYGDIVLTYAEAAAHLGKEDEAMDAMDMIRKRAQNGGAYPQLVDRTLTGEALLDEIFWDRSRELCFEGHSRFDIVRQGEEKYLELMTNQEYALKFAPPIHHPGEPFPEYKILPGMRKVVNWADKVDVKYMLFPIPETEMTTNTAMEGHQNPGYN